MRTAQIKGKIFEVILKHQLRKHGYVIIPDSVKNYYGVSKERNGLNVKGRGAKHQIDALGQFSFQIPFVYPVRLLSEAKCYNKNIDLPIIRNFVGVLKDISENYMIAGNNMGRFRFTDCGAIFSTSDFSKAAQDYAYAQGIYLVQMKGVHSKINRLSGEIGYVKSMNEIEQRLQSIPLDSNEIFYFGVASGRYPVVISGNSEIPISLYKERDDIPCKIYYNYDFITKKVYYFKIKLNDWEGYFELPRYIWDKYMKMPDFKEAMLNMKEDVLGYIDVPLLVNEVRRIIRLKLDKNWTELVRNDLRRYANETRR